MNELKPVKAENSNHKYMVWGTGFGVLGVSLTALSFLDIIQKNINSIKFIMPAILSVFAFPSVGIKI